MAPLHGAPTLPTTAAVASLQELSRRLEELEQEGAQRNGSVERMQFAIEAIARRVDEIQKDYDIRFNELERRLQVLESRPMAPAAGNAAAVSPAVTTPASVSITVPANISATTLYEKAYAYLTATQYQEAEAWLQEFIKRHPTDALADNAFYWLGESRLVQNNPAGAVQAFRDGLRAFPKGQKAPDNLFKMGVALEQLKQPQLAKAAWDKLVKDYPTNPLAERAKARLAGLKL
ncbi:MAG: tol-pal system protein YbgF [Alphaproteobacteria bacterium]|nr:tol-pal system protein YbgF [Alphaproteobacteria bacterium]